MRLTGKTAFVTAAGQGIGRAIAERFVSEGAHVVATDLNAGLLTGLDGADCRTLDVLNRDAVTQMISDIAPEVLVNCAGFVHSGTIDDATDEEFDFAMNLNVRSMMHTIKAALPGMRAAGKGSIINIASIASSVKGFPNRVIYSASKGAVIGLTKAVAVDVMTQGIRINCICPGTVDSPSLHDRLRATGDYDAAMMAFIARQPMGRLGTADEMAGLACYMATDESAYMTGQAVAIDGGTTA